jgi:hypothetical protein
MFKSGFKTRKTSSRLDFEWRNRRGITFVGYTIASRNDVALKIKFKEQRLTKPQDQFGSW